MDNVLFTSLTMNLQPLHLDEEFSKEHDPRPAGVQQPVHRGADRRASTCPS